MGNKASITKIATRIVYLEQEIRLRKQKFRCARLSQPQWLQPSSSFTEQELEIEACVDKANDDIRRFATFLLFFDIQRYENRLHIWRVYIARPLLTNQTLSASVCDSATLYEKEVLS